MAKWTPEDLEALQQTAHLSGMDGYRTFVGLGGTRSFDSWEVKRRRIGIELPPIDLPTRAPEVVPMGAFKGFKVGYFDIETTFSTQPIVLYAAIADQFGRVEQFRKGDDITNDRELVAAYAKALEGYDILVSWNGKLFDVPVLNGRLNFHGLAPLNIHMHVDLMYYASGQFNRIGRRSLQSVSEYFNVQNRKTPLNVRTWDRAMSGDPAAYEKIAEHCDADVLVLRDVFDVLKRNVRNVHRGG